MPNMPVGVDSFADIRDPSEGFFYSDKTRLLHELVAKSDTPYFLSRPRRFGKTLLADTLEAILKGRRELFTACAPKAGDSESHALPELKIAGLKRDWTPRPVIRISLASTTTTSVESLETTLNDKLKGVIMGLPDSFCW